MAQITRDTFLKSFMPMAKAGKSAVEIARTLGMEGEDKAVSMKVSQQAGKYRKEFKAFAVADANKKELEGEEREKYLDSVDALIPKLKTRTREKAKALGGMIAQMLADADSE